MRTYFDIGPGGVAEVDVLELDVSFDAFRFVASLRIAVDTGDLSRRESNMADFTSKRPN